VSINYLEKTTDGLIGRHHYNNSFWPFDTADWDVPASGLSLSLSSGKLRCTYTLSSGDKIALYNQSGQSLESDMMVWLQTDYNNPLYFGCAALCNDNETATIDGILTGHPLKFNGTATISDFASGSGTNVDFQASVNSNSPLALSLWADGTNAWAYNWRDAFSMSGAMVNTPQTGYAGIYLSAGAAGSINVDITHFLAMKGHLVTVTGLSGGMIARVYDDGGSVIDSATESGGSVSLNIQSADWWPIGNLAVFESDGTTLVATDLNVYGGDTWELKTGSETSITITNPGAESGVTGWTAGPGSPIPSQDLVVKRTGTASFLLTAPVAGTSYRYQDYTIPSDLHSQVDDGNLEVQIVAWMTGDTMAGGSAARVYIDYYDGTPGSLISGGGADAHRWEDLAKASWIPYGRTHTVPTLTRTLRIYLWATRPGVSISIWTDDLEANFISVGPETPTVTVSNIQANQATVTGSAFVAGGGGGTHASTTYTIRKASDDSLVVTTTTSVAGELLSLNVGPLLTNTSMYAQMTYTDSNGGISLPGQSANFSTTTQDTCFRDGNIDHTDTGLTKIGLLSPDPWGSYSAIGNPLDNKLISFYWGSVLAPRGLLLNECDPHVDAVVTVLGGFDGEVASGYPATPLPVGLYGYTWGKYWSIEFSGLGAWALAGGEYGNPANPLTGVFAFLRIGVPWPYGTCASSPKGGGTSLTTSSLEVQIWEDDKKVKSVINSVSASIQAVNRACSLFTQYGVRLQVVRDLGGDPTGKTWDIKAQWEEGAIPDGTSWTTEFAYTSSVLSCGLGGAGTFNLPGAAGGASGAVFINEFTTTNLSDYCKPPTEVPNETQPTAVASANCGFITASAAGWSGATVGPITTAKWDFRLNADSTLLYTTGWQSEFLQYIQINMYDHPEIPYGTSIDVQVTFGDGDEFSTITPIATVTTGEPPNTPTLVLKGIFLNRIIVIAGPFSSNDATATHQETTLSVFLASDTEFETPLVTDTWTTPETLTGELYLEYDFDTTVSYTARIVYTDQYGCTSSALTSSEALEDDEEIDDVTPPNKICPLYAACVVSAEGSWVACALTGEAAWVPETADEATWDGTCINNC
jgi:hypothetical protein